MKRSNTETINVVGKNKILSESSTLEKNILQNNKQEKNKEIEYVRENYCKYDRVERELLVLLEDNTPAKEAAKTLGISLPTLYKYKGIASIKHQKLYVIPEEERFLRKK